MSWFMFGLGLLLGVYLGMAAIMGILFSLRKDLPQDLFDGAGEAVQQLSPNYSQGN
jgi:hypothetical protein